MKKLTFLCSLLLSSIVFSGDAQIVSELGHFHSCASHDILKNIDQHERGFLEEIDAFTEELARSGSSHVRSNTIYEIPVVFHIVYNTPEENLPDSVIENQLEILNAAFRRTNADAANTREEFLDIVGDAEIEFKLAEFDPEGNPTSGITRTNTDVTHFGGLLPYGPGQNSQIIQWVNDSLFYNYFRLSDPEEGGIAAWDPASYLNIFIGDLRIFEPEFDDFEELVYFGLATPPLDHFNWPSGLLPTASNIEDGVFMHYVNIGSNNPNSFPAPYNVFNGITNTGKMLVHEVGHYLGLRHIWGDGPCSADDFIEDTPNANIDSQWTCDTEANTCTDDIGGVDLPNMIENYMDYSTGDCQNAFTVGQIELMRSVLVDYRPELAEVFVGLEEQDLKSELKLYPNPNSGQFNIEFERASEIAHLRILNGIGQAIHSQSVSGDALISLDLELSPGIYFVELSPEGQQPQVERVVVR